MNNLWKAIKDYWLLVAIIGSGIYSAIDSVKQLSEYGLIKNEWELGVGVIFFVVFVALAVLKMAKKARDLEKKSENKLPDSNISKHQPILENNQQRVNDNAIGLQNPVFNAPVSFVQSERQPKQHEIFDIVPNIIRNEKWVSASVPNPLNKKIECYCIWSSIQVDGELREDIKRYITAHSYRVSWSGGDTKGKEEGVKCIDPGNSVGMLNIATPTYAGLRFETAGGPRDLGYDMQYGKGAYKISLDIRYRPTGEGDFQSKIFEVVFVCDIKPVNFQINVGLGQEEKHDSNIIKCEFGPQALTDFIPVRDCIYVEIVK